MALKERTCKDCHCKYMPWRPAQPRCKDCHITWEVEKKVKKAMAIVNKSRQGKKKQVVAKRRADKDRVKTRAQWLKDAQTWFNRYIRLRDSGDRCISCGRDSGAKLNAGHYKSVGSTPELRFNELNCHSQCEHCNSYKSGNIENYRPKLVEKIGLENVEWLEGPHDPAKYTIDDIKEIIAKYKLKCKELTG